MQTIREVNETPIKQNVVDSDQINKKIIQSIKANTFRDRAFGCILGSFIGDSCGSSLNKNKQGYSTSDEVNRAMSMLGGGPWSIGPGQVTDQSELSMCLMSAIIEANSSKKSHEERHIDTDIIAQHYSRWMKSNPFDLEETVKNSLTGLLKV